MCENGTFNQDVKCLKKLQSDCQIRKEPVLEYYCDCMLKIRRAYYKAEQTDLLFYIKQIMSAAFPLVVKYFVLCVEEYHKETDFCQRARILRDIEESVVKFDEMFDSIIHATNSVDRILFQTAPIATATHIAAPKLCAYYSKMMNQLTSLLMKTSSDDLKYGFCVYPTLNSGAETKILFSTVERTGKVAIIWIPAYKIADIKKIRVYLFHELFHVIPGEDLRRRKDRAEVFLKLLMYNVREHIFLDCDFSFLSITKYSCISQEDWDNQITEVKEIITQKLFKDTADRVNKAIDKNDPRAYYSTNIKNVYLDVFCQDFTKLLYNGTQSLFEELLGRCSVSGLCYSDYEQVYQGIERLCQCINKNIYELIAADIIYESCNFYMDIFRETFADLMMISTLHLSRAEYLDALKYIDQEHLYGELFTVVRMFLVSRVMKERSNECKMEGWKTPDNWEDYINNLKDEKEISSEQKELIQTLSADNQEDCDIGVTQVIMDQYIDSLRKCVIEYESMKKMLGEKYTAYSEVFLCDDENEIIQGICCRKWDIEE